VNIAGAVLAGVDLVAGHHDRGPRRRGEHRRRGDRGRRSSPPWEVATRGASTMIAIDAWATQTQAT